MKMPDQSHECAKKEKMVKITKPMANTNRSEQRNTLLILSLISPT